MKSENYTTTILTADEGMVLTNGEIYGTAIALGKGDSAENYREITREQYDRLMESLQTEEEQT